MTEHTLKKFDQDIESIRSGIIRMGGIVESMVKDALVAIDSGDGETIERVLQSEKEVNSLEKQLDKQIAESIAIHQPAAIDLRFMVSNLKMITDLERAGDESEKIVKIARKLHETGVRYEPLVDMRHMGILVLQMIDNVFEAYSRRDVVKAAEVVRSDKMVDKEWKNMLRTLSSFLIEDPRRTTEFIDHIFVARSIERIGDHMKNIAERIIYLVHGEDVRHEGVKYAEQIAKGDSEEE